MAIAPGLGHVESVYVNKRELVQILDIALPTLDKWIADNPDFPIVERGSNGREWRFDAVAVKRWLAQLEENERTEEAERQRKISQIVLPLGGDGPLGDALPGGSPVQRLQLMKAAQIEQNLAVQAGQLVEKAKVRTGLQTALGLARARLRRVPGDVKAECAVPDAVVRVIERILDDACRGLVADIKTALSMSEVE
jgi:phage terminase Nu1 subunit (DNA packaging protein)